MPGVVSKPEMRGYVRFPAIHGDRIVFTAEDDLWMVTVGSSRAERLTAGVAEATHARFSPDGQTLAFSGRDEGPAEVYTMSSTGGPATRLTFQGEQAAVAGWHADGSTIIYSSATGQPLRGMRMLHAIAPAGGFPTALSYGLANAIAFSPHGGVVLGRNIADPARWKRYRGGTAGYLWVDATGKGEFRRLVDLDGNMANPCWIGERIYFVSDHEGIGNIYSCLPDGADFKRHTDHDDYYARGLASDGVRLVYHAGGDLFLLEPQATTSTRLDVEVPGSRAQLARKFTPASHYLDGYAPNPDGKYLALTTRGKAFTMGNWDGPAIQHGSPDGPRYRLATWLADGKRLVAVRDGGDDPRLVVFTADGSADELVLSTLDAGHVVEMRASPVGERVVLRNHRTEIVLVDVGAGTMRVIDQSPFGREEDLRRMHGLAWSPDGQWAAYSFRINAQQTAIKLCWVETGEIYQITEPVLADLEPAFDPAGRYLYFVGSRDFDPVEDRAQFEFSFPLTQRPYLVTLRKDLRSPFERDPEDAAEAAKEPSDATKDHSVETPANGNQPAGDNGAKAADKPSVPEPVRVDLEGITTRVVAFPLPEGRYTQILGTQDGVVISAAQIEGTRRANILAQQGPKTTLLGYRFESQKTETLAEGIADFDVTADGKTLVYRAGDRLRVLKAGDKAPEDAGEQPGRESGWIDLDRAKVSIAPTAEWHQMFDEAWRLQREQFWTADMGSVDWDGVHSRYAPLVDRIRSRSELSDLFWEMQGELGTSHAYEFGGEYRPHPEFQQGFLGVDWRYDAPSGQFSIARILRGDPWDQDSTSPLLAPGVNVAVGDVVLAINGQKVSVERSPQQLLVNQAKAQVRLLVQPADGGAPRSVTVRTIANEQPARYRDWVEANRRAVDGATKGRVGYLHLPDMAYDGFAEFHRQYLTQFDREGMIVDVRWNGGGMVSPLILEKLARARVGYGFSRWGAPSPYPPESPLGPLVALTDEHAGSDGDIFSHVFKLRGLGPLIGKRTWGGVIGIDPYVPLTDGTVTTQPEFAFWFKDVGWGVENYGTDPTIEVDYTPQDYARGYDPQLARGISEALRLIEERPGLEPKPGPRPQPGAQHWKKQAEAR